MDLVGNWDEFFLADSEWLLCKFPFILPVFCRFLGDLDFVPLGDLDLLFLADLDLFPAFFLDDFVFDLDLPIFVLFGIAPVDGVGFFFKTSCGSTLAKASYPTKPQTFPEKTHNFVI